MFFIEGFWYQYIYIFIVFLLTIKASQKLDNYNKKHVLSFSRHSSDTLGLIIAIFIAVFIGLRPRDKAFVDMGGYIDYYTQVAKISFNFRWETDNTIFDNLFAFLAYNNISWTTFMLCIAVIYFLCAYLACRKLFPKDTFLSYLVFLAAFSTFSYATNGIKAGVASSIFLLAIAYRENHILSIILALISLGFHHAMQMVVAAFFIVSVLRQPKIYIFFWTICIILAFLHITIFQDFIGSLTDSQGATYFNFDKTDKSWSQVLFFRYDFILYSSIPIVFGIYLTNKYKINSSEYKFIFNLYTLTNSIWMLCMYTKFNNRIAYLSWFIYPIVLIYPFIKLYWSPYQFQYLRYVLWGHFLFTAFMVFIYY